VALDAGIRIDGDGRMVSLLVELLGQFENVLRTVFHTESAPLTPFLDDVDIAVGHLDLVTI
jgi:hypothetical protein